MVDQVLIISHFWLSPDRQIESDAKSVHIAPRNLCASVLNSDGKTAILAI